MEGIGPKTCSEAKICIDQSISSSDVLDHVSHLAYTSRLNSVCDGNNRMKYEQTIRIHVLWNNFFCFACSVPIKNTVLKAEIVTLNYCISVTYCPTAAVPKVCSAEPLGLRNETKFLLQLDESTDVAGLAVLMTFVQYEFSDSFHEDILF
ncbi:hypothetical protein ANN_01044 [Periplaneta americana]|uniref:Uncharacterized protein n=1 Tax=Periplaneta americana TaxID=6978 RepID=A0ABQ8TWI6_PERAM|nr:hypothetical protein ANN_01044 [Periplaneta americana]